MVAPSRAALAAIAEMSGSEMVEVLIAEPLARITVVEIPSGSFNELRTKEI
ncbi:unannotated protein [freshwater metagenome]|uniref:Unannotated protein n=1 Tax=freshwater metagenome TaxID=449393 RepID=A0A6J7EEL0_9ZZZZ